MPASSGFVEYAAYNVIILLYIIPVWIVLQHSQFVIELGNFHIFQMQILLLSSSCWIDGE